MNIKKQISFLITSFCIASFSHADPSETLKDELDRALALHVSQHKSPGISVAVSIDGAVVYSGQAGLKYIDIHSKEDSSKKPQ